MRFFFWVCVVNFVWGVWLVSLLALTFQQLDKQAEKIRFIPPELTFAESRRDYDFADSSSAKVTVDIRLSEPARQPLRVAVRLPQEWFDVPAANVVVAPEDKAGSVEVPLKRIPEPGQSTEFALEFGEIGGRAIPRPDAKHVVVVRNARLPRAELTVKSPAPPILLREPMDKAVSAAANVTLELTVTPPRAARIEIRLAGDAKPNVDFRLDGAHLGADGGRLFVLIPSGGASLVRVEALHNEKERNRVPKTFEISFAPGPGDVDLTLKSAPIVGQIANIDRNRLQVLAAKNLDLFESNSNQEVVLRLEPLTEVSASTEVQFKSSGTPGLVESDFSATWEPSATILGLGAVSLRIRAKNDEVPERVEKLTIQFPDGDDYEIVGQREFAISILDDDRKLTAGLDATEVLEGNSAVLELKFDPPDDETSQVDLRLSKGNPDRFSLMSDGGKALTPVKDPQGRTKFEVRAPGKYRINAADNQELDYPDRIEFEFIPPAIPQFQLPQSSLGLALRDDDSDGNVLLVVACTKYVQQRAQPDKLLDPNFLKRFAKIRELGATNKLVGDGVYFVGRANGGKPTYLLWKGDPVSLASFAARHAFVSPANETPDCLVDCLQGSHDFVRHYRERVDPAQKTQVIFVWPSDEEPRFDSCLANKAPAPFEENTTARFVWWGGDEGQLGRTFGPEAPIEGLYKLFPRNESTLSELPGTSHQTLAEKITELLGVPPAP